VPGAVVGAVVVGPVGAVVVVVGTVVGVVVGCSAVVTVSLLGGDVDVAGPLGPLGSEVVGVGLAPSSGRVRRAIAAPVAAATARSAPITSRRNA
jgi:hypothetical protein